MLLASALGKSCDIQGFVDVLATYRLLPDWSLWTLAFGITGSEWALVVWILVGWQLPTGALLVMAMNGLYVLGLIITLVRGLDLPNLWTLQCLFPTTVAVVFPGRHLLCVTCRDSKIQTDLLTRFPNRRSEEIVAHLSIEVREIG